jgi:hypothetical protein
LRIDLGTDLVEAGKPLSVGVFRLTKWFETKDVGHMI